MYYKRACSFGSLYKGLKRSCRNVRWKDSVTGYEANGLKNTLELSEREKVGTVAPGSTLESVRAFLANADRGNTWRIQQNMKQYYAECTGGEFK